MVNNAGVPADPSGSPCALRICTQRGLPWLSSALLTSPVWVQSGGQAFRGGVHPAVVWAPPNPTQGGRARALQLEAPSALREPGGGREGSEHTCCISGSVCKTRGLQGGVSPVGKPWAQVNSRRRGAKRAPASLAPTLLPDTSAQACGHQGLTQVPGCVKRTCFISGAEGAREQHSSGMCSFHQTL